MADNLAGPTESISSIFYTSPKEELRDEPTDEDEEVSEDDTEETVADDDESEAESEEGDDEDEELEAIEIDGEEVTLSQIQEWRKEAKDGGLRQADYTKKTMALAEDQRKVTELNTKLEDSILELETLIAESDDVDIDELWEIDPSAARKHEKKIEQRAKTLEAAKSKRAEVDQLSIREESKKLREALPQWFEKDGSLSEAQKKDAALIQTYAKKIGLSTEDTASFTDHRIILALLDAAKYSEVKTNAKKVTKVKKKVLSTAKAKSASKKPAEKSIAELFYGKN